LNDPPKMVHRSTKMGWRFITTRVTHIDENHMVYLVAYFGDIRTLIPDVPVYAI